MRAFLCIAVIAMLTVSSAGARGGGSGRNDCGDGDGGHELTWTPAVLWPPNHKYVDVTITYSDASEEHQLMLAATSATHDEMNTDGSELNGAGNTDEDVVLPADAATGTGSVSVIVRVRGERSGRGDGRVYTVDYTATSMDGEGQDNDCSGQITVAVPHDCRKGQCDVTKQSGAGAESQKARSKK